MKLLYFIGVSYMSKRELTIILVSTFFGALISTFVFLWIAKLGHDVGSLADWFGAIGTTAAVVVALLPQIREEKPEVVFSEPFVEGRRKTRLVYSNLSGTAGYYKLVKSRFKNNNGDWTEFKPNRFDQGFMVAPYQQEQPFTQKKKLACPNAYLDETKYNKYGEAVNTIKVNWEVTELTYVDRDHNAKAVLKIVNNGVTTKLSD